MIILLLFLITNWGDVITIVVAVLSSGVLLELLRRKFSLKDKEKDERKQLSESSAKVEIEHIHDRAQITQELRQENEKLREKVEKFTDELALEKVQCSERISALEKSINKLEIDTVKLGAEIEKEKILAEEQSEEILSLQRQLRAAESTIMSLRATIDQHLGEIRRLNKVIEENAKC